MRTHNLTIGTSQEKFDFSGNYVRLESGAASIRFETEENEEFRLNKGEYAKLHNFTYLLIEHDELTEQDIVLEIGNDTSKGSALFSGSVDVNGGALDTPVLSDGYYVSLASIALQTLVTPASNINGIRVLGAGGFSDGAYWRYMAKTIAPTGADDPLALTIAFGAADVTAPLGNFSSTSVLPAVIPPGYGLYLQHGSLQNVRSWINYEVL